MARHENQTFTVKAKENWRQGGTDQIHSVLCDLYFDWGTNGEIVYDGGEPSRPAIEVRVMLPSNGSRDPNVVAGDIMQVTRAKFRQNTNRHDRFVPVGSDYLEDPIHTIKMQTTLNVRPGWGLADGEVNSGFNGGTGEDFRGRVPIGVETRSGGDIPEHSDAAYQLGLTGGSRTHAHAGTVNATGVGAGVTGSAASSNVQPWGVVAYVQRLNNSVNYMFP